MGINIILGLHILIMLGLLAYCECYARNTDKLRNEGTVAFQDVEAADESTGAIDATERIDVTETIDAKEQTEPEEYDVVLTVVDASGNSREVPVHIIAGDNNEIVEVTLENVELDSLESEEEFGSYEEIALLFAIMLVIICVLEACAATMG